ncbi:dUTP diphosphatase [Patescibacteria group bacterium]|nr:dUTP diphosphatase [Patescibacteria group bacterium]
MNIKIRKIRDDAKVPIRASDGAIGYDVFASRVLDKHTKEVISDLPVEISPGKSVLIGIGVQMAIPWLHQAEMRPRSGLASKYDIELSNSPGTIDPDFRGEAGALLRNRGEKPFTVEKNMRIAQLIFSKVEIPVLEETVDLSDTKRGGGGFGSTGLFGAGLGIDSYNQEIIQRDRYYMGIALAAAKRSTCIRGVKKINGKYERDSEGNLVGGTRKFGCVIVKNDNIIAHGFNDQYPGSPKCADVGCLREELKIPSGEQIEKCRAVHAEWWAIANMARSGTATGTEGASIYLNGEPCEICAKLIAYLGVDEVVMLEGVYPTNGTQIIRDAGINVRYVKID